VWNGYFTTINSSNMKTIPDRQRLADKLSGNISINDLKPQKWGFTNFFTILGYDTHFKRETRIACVKNFQNQM